MEIDVNRFDNEREFANGSMFRIYNVKRPDIMKYAEDFSNPDKQKLDYYDILICDTNEKDSFSAINITIDSGNRGLFYCRVSKMSKKINGKQIFINLFNLKSIKNSFGADNVYFIGVKKKIKKTISSPSK